jgi:hypothetical protein
MVTPGFIAASWYIVPPMGMALMISGVTARVCAALCTSINGDCAVTVMVSVIEPTFSSAFTGAVKFAGSSTPSRLLALNPVRVKVTA